MRNLVLIVMLGGERIALRTDDVQSVIELEALTPVPCAPSHVAGLSSLRSRLLTVIDCRSSLGLGTAAPEPGTPAAVVTHDGHAYALLLESVLDVTEAHCEAEPVRTRTAGNWATMSHGVVETNVGPLMLIDVAALIAGPEEARAA